MKNLSVYSILLLVFVCATQPAQSTNFPGAEITYKCTATPGVWEIKMVFYRDCNGLRISNCMGGCGSSCSFILPIYGADSTCVGSTIGAGSVTLNLVNVRDANMNIECPSAKNACTNQSCVSPGTFQPSIERYEFSGNVNLGPTSGIPSSCCNVRIVYTECCPNANIDNMVPSVFYTEAIINRCLSSSPCNSSPINLNEPSFVICANENYMYNNGAFDPDNDSLSFEFTQALNAHKSFETYTAPFDYYKPLPWTGNVNGTFPSGIKCDPHTGNIMFKPGNSGSADFVGFVSTKTTQFKKINGVPTVIGITRRDVKMNIRPNCTPNNPPSFTTYPSNGGALKTEWEVASGEQLCFTIVAQDPDFNFNTTSLDTTFLSWNASLATFGATFVSNYDSSSRRLQSPNGTGPIKDSFLFCWQPNDSHINNIPYFFTVTGKDNHCPIAGSITRSFSVKVFGKVNLSINKINNNCGKWQLSYTNNDLSRVPDGVSWLVSSEPGDFAMINNPYVSNAITPPPFLFSKPGKYLVILNASAIGQVGMDRFMDTIEVVDTLIRIIVKDTFTCLGNSVKIYANAQYGNAGGYEFKWFNSIIDSNKTPLNTPNFTTSNVTVNPETPSFYTIQVSDIAGCKAYDSLKVIVGGRLDYINTIQSNCTSLTNGRISIFMKDTFLKHQYKLNNGDFQVANYFDSLQADTYSIAVIDTVNCTTVFDSIIVTQQQFSSIVESIPTSCFEKEDGELFFIVDGGNVPYSFQLNNRGFTSNNQFTDLAAGNYTFSIRDNLNCLLTDNAEVVQAIKVTGEALPTAITCHNGSNGSIEVVGLTGVAPYTYNLNGGMYTADSIFTNLGVNTYSIGMKDNDGCLDTIIVSLTNPPPIVAGNISGANNTLTNTQNVYSILPQQGLNYLWIVQKGTILNGQTTPSITVNWDSLGTGEVKAIIFKEVDCGDTTSMAVNIGSVGIDEHQNSNIITVFPNPNNGDFILKFPTNQMGNSDIELSDMLGVVVFQKRLLIQQGSTEIEIKSQLAKGVYMLHINGQLISKVVVK